MPESSTRDQIIEAADELFYQQGYEHTSFAHIASAVGISRGNFYHHFRSKDEILASVIDFRLTKTQKMLDLWKAQSVKPLDRINSFVQMLIANRAKLKLYGCPVGSLCTELAKLNHVLKDDANKLFTLFRNWLRDEFVLLGHKENSDELAMHLLARSQGVATLASAFQSEKFIKQEVNHIHEWLKKL